MFEQTWVRQTQGISWRMLPANEISEGLCLHLSPLSSVFGTAAGPAPPSAAPATTQLSGAREGNLLRNLLCKLKFGIKGSSFLFEVKSRLETWRFGGGSTGMNKLPRCAVAPRTGPSGSQDPVDPFPHHPGPALSRPLPSTSRLGSPELDDAETLAGEPGAHRDCRALWKQHQNLP